MSSPKPEEEEVWITVKVMSIVQQRDDSGRPLKRKFEDAEEVATFAVFGMPRENLAAVWRRAEREFKKSYGADKTGWGYFSKMRARGADVFMHFRVSQIFRPGMKPDDYVLVVLQDPNDRISSIPPQSNLRPAGFMPPTPYDDFVPPDSVPAKRRKVHGAEYSMTIDEIDPERPIESNERADGAGQVNQVTEPGVDTEGFRIPPIPSNRRVLPAQSRQPTQSTGASQANLLIQDSQPQMQSAKPHSAKAALWLKKQADERHQSMASNHSSPAEAAAIRAKSSVPQPLQINQSHNSASTIMRESDPKTSSGQMLENIPTPTSERLALSDIQQAPTSAQPRTLSRTPLSGHVRNYINRTSLSDPTVDDPIVDDDEYFDAMEDDIVDDEEDVEYVPPGGIVHRGRTRSRSLETVQPDRNVSDIMEEPTSQLLAVPSTTPASRSAPKVPTSSSAFDSLRSSQASHSSARKTSADLWSRAEDIALLIGMKNGLVSSVIIKRFNLDRTTSSLRNRKQQLLKMFPEGIVPTDHEYYDEVESETNPGTTATKIVASSRRTLWTQEHRKIIFEAVARGMDATEIRQAHFASRSQECVLKKVKELRDNAIAREKKATDFPRDDMSLLGWTDLHSLKLRRAVSEDLSLDDTWGRFFGDFSLSSIQKKMQLYKDQLEKSNSGHAPNTAVVSSVEESVDLFEEAGRRQTAQTSTALQPHGWTPVNASQPNQQLATETTLGPPPPLRQTEQSSRQPLNQPTPHGSPPQRRLQQRRSPQVVIESQLKTNKGKGGQTKLSFKRDKQKGVTGPSRAALRAQADQEFDRASSRVEIQPSPIARPIAAEPVTTQSESVVPSSVGPVTAKSSTEIPPTAEPATAVLDDTNDADILDLRDQQDDEFFDVDEVLMTAEERKLLRQIDSHEEREDGDELYEDFDARPRTAGSAPSDQLTQELEQSASVTPVPDSLENKEHPKITATDSLKAMEPQDSVDESQAFQTQNPATTRSQRALKSRVATPPRTRAAQTNAQLGSAYDMTSLAPQSVVPLVDRIANAVNSAQSNSSHSATESQSGRLPNVNGAGARFALRQAAEVAAEADANSSLSARSTTQVQATPPGKVAQAPVVTEPRDLRTWLTKPDASGKVMVGRPEFPVSFHKDSIESDERIWERAMKIHKKCKVLAKTQLEIDRLSMQGLIALTAQDWDEQARLDKKSKLLQRFLYAKEKKKIDLNVKFEDWQPVGSATDGKSDDEVDRDFEMSDGVLSDFDGYEEEEDGYGAVLPDEQEFPNGVIRDREIIEVKDEEDGEGPSNVVQAIQNGSIEEFEDTQLPEPSVSITSDQNDLELPGALPTMTEEDAVVPTAQDVKSPTPNGDVDMADDGQEPKQEKKKRKKLEKERRKQEAASNLKGTTKRKRPKAKNENLDGASDFSLASMNKKKRRKNDRSDRRTSSSSVVPSEDASSNNVVVKRVDVPASHKSIPPIEAPKPAGGNVQSSGFFGNTVNIIGRALQFRIPDVPVRRTPPPAKPTQLPYPSDEDSSSSESSDD